MLIKLSKNAPRLSQPMIKAVIFSVVAVFIPATSYASGLNLDADLAETLGNIAYAGIYDEPVLLTDGVYEGEPFVPGGAARPRVELLKDLYTSADIDGDGNEDAWVLLNESSGGSGQYLFLAAVADSRGKPRNLGTIVIGDRVDVVKLEADDSHVSLEYVSAGPGEAACCPTQITEAVYGMKDGQLAELSREKRGTLSLDKIAGATWHLTHFAWDEPITEGVTITARFEDGRISGNAGCNNYFATIEAPTPYDLSIGPVGSTRMACPPPQLEAEDRYLKAIKSAKQFTYLLGRLAVLYEINDEHKALMFKRGTEK